MPCRATGAFFVVLQAFKLKILNYLIHFLKFCLKIHSKNLKILINIQSNDDIINNKPQTFLNILH